MKADNRMVFQPAKGVVECKLKYTRTSQPILNVLHVWSGKADPWVQADLDALGNVFEATFWEGQVRALTPTAIRYNGATLTDLIAQNALQSVYTPSITVQNGSYSFVSMPGNVTFAFKLQTANRWHGASGRYFVPVLPYNQVIVDTLAGGGITLWKTALLPLQSAIPAAVAGASLCVLSRRHQGVRLHEAVPYPVTSITNVNTFLASQRDRLSNHRALKRRH